MIAYVGIEENVQVGEQVVLELRRDRELLAVIQVSKVVRVVPSPHHRESDNMAEVEF